MDASVHRAVQHGIMCVHLMKRNLHIVRRSTEPNREKSVKVTKPAVSKFVTTVKLWTAGMHLSMTMLLLPRPNSAFAQVTGVQDKALDAGDAFIHARTHSFLSVWRGKR